MITGCLGMCRRAVSVFLLLALIFFPVGEREAAAQQDIVIILDPGHGGDDTGIRGPGGLTEKEVCLDLALRVKKRVDERLGYPTLLTRSRDEAVSPRERASQANNDLGTMFVGIHLGGFPDPATEGFAVYCLGPAAGESAPDAGTKGSLSLWDAQQMPYLEQSRRLAESLHQVFAKQVSSQKDLGVYALPVFPLTAVGMPAAVIEPAVLTGPAQEDRLRKDSFREEIAEAVFQGIRLFLGPAAEEHGHE